jgi:hypothetical protein
MHCQIASHFFFLGLWVLDEHVQGPFSVFDATGCYGLLQAAAEKAYSAGFSLQT